MKLPRIETDRLVLRAPSRADLAAMPGVFSDPDIHAYTRSFPYPYTTRDAAEALDRFERFRGEGAALTLFIDLKASEQLIGSIGFLNIKGTAEAEFGYVIGRAWWGNGYATEACRGLLAFGYETLGFAELCAHAMVRNPASVRVLEKLGMRSLGVLQGACEKDGERFDAEGFVLTKTEWESRRGAH